MTVLSVPRNWYDCVGRKRPLGAGPDASAWSVEQVANDLDAILEKGMREAVARCANTLNPVSTGFLILLYYYNILYTFIINRCHMQRLLMCKLVGNL